MSTARRTHGFRESVIRGMTRLAREYDSLNLAQGFPNFPAPDLLKEAAARAIAGDINQYAITWGAKPFRDAISAKYRRTYGLEIDPEQEITVCCGSTEGMIASLLAVTDPGDEVIIFEPYYENYGPDTMLCSADRKFVKLYPPEWRFDPDELRRAFSPLTKAIIINSPGNPTGHVLDREQLEYIAQLCQEFDALAITDEIYEHIIYDGAKHISPITLDGMRERTIVVNGMSKTFSVTGWRVGYIIAPPGITGAIRKMHDFLTVGAPAPLQDAGAVALRLPDQYYIDLAAHYVQRRDRVMRMLEQAGLNPMLPKGAYYIMCDIAKWGYPNDVEFSRFLVTDIGVATVPGSSFFSDPAAGKDIIRFTFCKKEETLRAAEERLSKLHLTVGRG